MSLPADDAPPLAQTYLVPYIRPYSDSSGWMVAPYLSYLFDELLSDTQILSSTDLFNFVS